MKAVLARILIYLVLIPLALLVIVPNSFDTLHLMRSGGITLADVAPWAARALDAWSKRHEHASASPEIPGAQTQPPHPADVPTQLVPEPVIVPQASPSVHDLAVDPETMFRVVVGFNSLASGTDPLIVKQVDDYLREQENRLGRTIYRKQARWGREGEFSLCFPLAEFDAVGQQQFVAGLRAALGATSRAGMAKTRPAPDDSVPEQSGRFYTGASLSRILSRSRRSAASSRSDNSRSCASASGAT